MSGVCEAFLRFEGGAILQVTENDKIRGAAVSIFDTGTNMVFNQAAAPTGWTQDASINDRVLRFVSGSGAVDGGSWTISGISVDGHVLTQAQLPSTDLEPTVARPTGGGVFVINAGGGGGQTKVQLGGSDQAHSHGLTIGSSWRPAYRDVIAATFD